jgi:hypothetical protein
MSIKINKKYVPLSLSQKDKEKQIKSIKEQTKRPLLKSYTSKRSTYTIKAKRYFGEGKTSKEDISFILSKGDKKREREIKKGLDLIYDKGMKAYYTSGSRPNQTPQSWGMARVFSVLFGGKSREVDKKEVEKYNLPKII